MIALMGRVIFGCRSLLSITLNISCQSFLACRVSVEKSTDRLMRVPFYLTNCFSLDDFKILSLSLAIAILIMICLGVGLFVLILFGTLHSRTCMSVSFARLGKFSVTVVFK